jgi:hypothetical protein
LACRENLPFASAQNAVVFLYPSDVIVRFCMQNIRRFDLTVGLKRVDVAGLTIEACDNATKCIASFEAQACDPPFLDTLTGNNSHWPLGTTLILSRSPA